jgi:hypothetical protein
MGHPHSVCDLDLYLECAGLPAPSNASPAGEKGQYWGRVRAFVPLASSPPTLSQRTRKNGAPVILYVI